MSLVTMIWTLTNFSRPDGKSSFCRRKDFRIFTSAESTGCMQAGSGKIVLFNSVTGFPQGLSINDVTQICKLFDTTSPAVIIFSNKTLVLSSQNPTHIPPQAVISFMDNPLVFGTLEFKRKRLKGFCDKSNL